MASILGPEMTNTFLQNYWLWDLNNHEFPNTIHTMHNPVQEGLALSASSGRIQKIDCVAKLLCATFNEMASGHLLGRRACEPNPISPPMIECQLTSRKQD
jgi:hypothetical protein